MLCKALRAAGHEVTLFAAAGSRDPGLFPICDAPYDEVLPWKVWRGTPELAAYQREAFERALAEVRRGGYDVVHNNSLFPDIIGWCADEARPCVTSHHVPPFENLLDAVCDNAGRPGIAFTIVSHQQQLSWSQRGGPQMHIVRNGVDTAFWSPGGDGTGEHFTWIGRIVPNKGVAHAVRAAREAGAELRIFGPVEDETYFAREVAPHLGDKISYRGHAPAGVLRDEVRTARGALVTPMWDEPFGLVAAEALACGTPVVGFDRGALQEVVGECGILVPGGDIEALAGAMDRAALTDRDACRRRAVAQLSSEAMIRGYEACYAAVIAGARGEVGAGAMPASSSSCASTSALLAKG